MTDENTDNGTREYTLGYGKEMKRALDRRSAEINAFHLLPHLKPGMRVLDFGCGSGTISVGLARAVEPGEFHGIDTEESQIEMARAAAKAGGHENAKFHVGDAAVEDGCSCVSELSPSSVGGPRRRSGAGRVPVAHSLPVAIF